jgi:hypothetical protein
MAIVLEERSVGCFDPGYRRLAKACQPVDYSTPGGAGLPEKKAASYAEKVK